MPRKYAKKRPAPTRSLGVNPLQIWHLEDAAEFAGLSVASIRRLHARGEGPLIIQLGPRRVGVRDRDLVEWLENRPVSKLHAEAAA
jgi:predicted DNA-binding transcriptional regulator AlpA